MENYNELLGMYQFIVNEICLKASKLVMNMKDPGYERDKISTDVFEILRITLASHTMFNKLQETKVEDTSVKGNDGMD